MKKEEAISYLQQLYPNGGHCWLDEQRIEAIDMAVKALQEEPVSEIGFEQELYKAFGHVKDFTLCLKIARRFYEMGRNYQEPVSEDLWEAAQIYYEELQKEKFEGSDVVDSFYAGAKWQREQINEVLLSEVLPCFMHGGEADEVVAKLEEVLNKNK